jgi:PsbP
MVLLLARSCCCLWLCGYWILLFVSHSNTAEVEAWLPLLPLSRKPLRLKVPSLVVLHYLASSTEGGTESETLPPSEPSPTSSSRIATSDNNKNNNQIATETLSNDTNDGALQEPLLQLQLPQQPPMFRRSRSSPSRQDSLSGSDMMLALGTSPRRIFLGLLSSSGIALGGNFLGITSHLLTLVPEDVVESTGIDTYFPRGEFKRCRGGLGDYTFVFPKEWVGDTFVELAKAQRMTQSLDYTMSRSSSNRRGGGGGILPDSAFGPPGRLNDKGVSEQGDTNVSVLVSPAVRPGVTLEATLGPPTTAAETLLRVSLAPAGSGRTASLVYAKEDRTRNVYQFAYTVDRGEGGGPPLRAISVIGVRQSNSSLITLTVVAPLKDWENPDTARKLERIANSFHVIE